MSMPPEPPPEGVLIESARKQHPEISIREAARRAGISEGWWRQVVKGYQSHSGGTYGTVRDVPAETVARMAKATGRITAEQMRTEGHRPDAAEIMPRLPDPRPDFTDDSDPALLPFRESVTKDLYRAIGLEFGPGQEIPEDPELDDLFGKMPGELLFSLQHEIATWDSDKLTPRQKRNLIARTRRLAYEHTAQQRRTGLLRS